MFCREYLHFVAKHKDVNSSLLITQLFLLLARIMQVYKNQKLKGE